MQAASTSLLAHGLALSPLTLPLSSASPLCPSVCPPPPPAKHFWRWGAGDAGEQPLLLCSLGRAVAAALLVAVLSWRLAPHPLSRLAEGSGLACCLALPGASAAGTWTPSRGSLVLTWGPRAGRPPLPRWQDLPVLC